MIGIIIIWHVTLPVEWALIFRKGSPKPVDRGGLTITEAPENPPIIGMLETQNAWVFWKDGCRKRQWVYIMIWIKCWPNKTNSRKLYSLSAESLLDLVLWSLYKQQAQHLQKPQTAKLTYRRLPHVKHHHCLTKLEKHSIHILHCHTQLNWFNLDRTRSRYIDSAGIALNTMYLSVHKLHEVSFKICKNKDKKTKLHLITCHSVITYPKKQTRNTIDQNMINSQRTSPLNIAVMEIQPGAASLASQDI
jgi:hypothetical protein